MKPALFVSVLSFGSLMSGSLHADETGAFTKWLGENAPRCVPVSEFSSVSRTIQLTPEQFEFVRALYVAIPPISQSLPPGDHAVLATASGEAMLALVSDNIACARFLAPDFIVAMLIEVGAGATGKVGERTSLGTAR